jgi:hypothetical protein
MMNQRFRQLAEQAKLKTELWNNPEPFVIYKEDVNYPGGLEKFAELIVRECAEQASIGNGHGNNQWDRALTFASKNIKEHFGVE